MEKYNAVINIDCNNLVAVILAAAMILEGTGYFLRCFPFSVAEQQAA